MRIITVSGNLAAKPEVLNARDSGETYLRFRLASHEYNDKEDETRWFEVIAFNNPAIANHFDKGSSVWVAGKYSDSTYTSDKYGIQINRKIIATDMGFWGGGKPANTDGTNAQTAPQQAQHTAPAAQAPAAPPVQEQAVSVPEANMDDDLPF